ncbi:MAG: hypothetical protein ISS93_01280 [Candidatus Aenigmarchaeota archaeon]|nr:hypothetical protein [Candidatus Aenigmarchaeota archaeon]
MVKYGETLSKALEFGIQPKRWLPLFIVDVIFALISLGYVFTNILGIKTMMGMQGIAVAPQIIGMILFFAVVFLVWFLVRIYISGSLYHQSYKEKEFDKSWKVAKQRYLSLLAVVIVVGIISGIVGMVPYIGWLFSIIVGLIFFFSMPMVIINKKDIGKSLKESYNIFKKRTIDVIICWLLISIITVIIVFVFAIPVLMAVGFTIIPMIVGASSGAGILTSVIANGWLIIPAIIILLVGLSISTVFSHYAQTHFYLQLRKRHLLRK